MDREIVIWDEPDREDLRFFSEDEAVEYILDDIDGPLPEKITICGYARMPISTELFHPLENILDDLDEEYGDPGGDPFEPTEKMKEAERTFLEVVQQEYEPWACEEVCRKEVIVADWVKENMPEWLEAQTKEGE